jgi:hypothetical protein
VGWVVAAVAGGAAGLAGYLELGAGVAVGAVAVGHSLAAVFGRLGRRELERDLDRRLEGRDRRRGPW